MTLTSAVKVEGIETILVSCDSMTSIPQLSEKTDDMQKLYAYSDFAFITTAGHLFKTNEVLSEVYRQDHKDFNSLLLNTINYVKTMSFKEDESIGLTLSGHQDDFMGIYEISRFGDKIYLNGKPIEECQIQNDVINNIDPRHLSLAGSGTRFIEQGQFTPGRKINDLTDALIQSFIATYAGSKDAGVNRSFQFGILTKKGMCILYPHDVQLQFGSDEKTGDDFFRQYLQLMTGLEMPSKFNTEDQLWETHPERRQDAKDHLGRVYDKVFADLREYRNAYNMAHEEFQAYIDGLTNDASMFPKTKERLGQLKENVTQGLTAILKKNQKGYNQYLIQVKKRETALGARLYA